MTTFTAHREVDVMDGEACLASLEVRYTFTVALGLAARTWATAADGFHPAEPPSVTVTEVETRWNPEHEWKAVTGQAWDMLTAEVPDEWFLDQATEDAK